MRKLGVSFDEQISPLLNADQQQRFQELRVQMRRRILEEAASQGVQKAKVAVEAWFAGTKK